MTDSSVFTHTSLQVEHLCIQPVGMAVSMLLRVFWETWLPFKSIIKVTAYISLRINAHLPELLVGWTPIHHAAYCDHVPIVRLLVNKYPELLEQATKDRFAIVARIPTNNPQSLSLVYSPRLCSSQQHPVP